MNLTCKYSINLQKSTVMRKINYFLAAVGAIVMTSCTNEEYVGESPGTTQVKKNEAIVFSGGASSLTRADLYGSAAAEKLGKKFVVYGTKHFNTEDKTKANDAVVFNNFQVAWTASTAGTTESNSSDWEYVGLQAYDATPTTQAIKYWDYSASNGHTFYAFSSTDISFPKNETSDKVQVTKVTEDASSLYNKGYSVLVKPGATLNNLYFSDRVPVAEANYDNTVSFTFRNIGAKVRVGFYETIPGYTVKIDKFYIDDDASAAVTSFAEMKNPQTDGFYASLQNVKSSVDQTLNVTYYDNNDATIENRPKLTNPTAGYNYSLKLGDGTGIIGKTLATDAASPTWVAGNTVDNFYIPVFPFEDNSNPMLLKLDFTLTAEDGSPDVIKVRGARAIVPTEFVKWKSNFAYTYLFKISDKTNGTTGEVDANGDPTDPTGLKAITFDAIVVDVTEELQQTITSVSTRSITTYAEGAIANEYKAGKPIYTAITTKTTGGVITPTAIGNAAKNAQIYKLSKAASEAEVLACLTGSPIQGLTLTATTGDEVATIGNTVPLVDGTNPAIKNVKFTPSAAGTYAYVYTTTAYVATTYKAASGAYDSGTTYYLRSGDGSAEHPYVYYAVSVPNADAYTENIDKLFVVETAGTPGDYDVKVIKVQ